jgi:hypothetical protein
MNVKTVIIQINQKVKPNQKLCSKILLILNIIFLLSVA